MTGADVARWHGCYDSSWRDLIVPEAFAHPAKMARGLVVRIFDELEAHARLVTVETRSHLFDGERTIRRERKSFFRRLAEKKGSPRIDYETVWFMRKP